MTIAIRKGNGAGEWCDRRSPLGNPFHLQSESQRDAVCGAYQQYFYLIVDHGYRPYLVEVESLRLSSGG